MLDWDNGDISIRKLVKKLGAAYAAPNKGTTILYWLGLNQLC